MVIKHPHYSKVFFGCPIKLQDSPKVFFLCTFFPLNSFNYHDTVYLNFTYYCFLHIVICLQHTEHCIRQLGLYLHESLKWQFLFPSNNEGMRPNNLYKTSRLKNTLKLSPVHLPNPFFQPWHKTLYRTIGRAPHQRPLTYSCLILHLNYCFIKVLLLKLWPCKRRNIKLAGINTLGAGLDDE